MCVVAVGFQVLDDAAYALAFNREEYFGRPTIGPAVQPGPPAVLCGTDGRAGGTWLGVNEHRLCVAVTNRYDRPMPAEARSRGTLCRELLDSPSAEQARTKSLPMLETGRFAGVNILLVDDRNAYCLQNGRQIESVSLPTGFHTLTNGNLNDAEDARQLLLTQELKEDQPRTTDAFLARAQGLFSRYDPTSFERSIILRAVDRGTVSSTLVAVTHEPGKAVYWYASDAPDRSNYVDHSPLLRGMLNTTLEP